MFVTHQSAIAIDDGEYDAVELETHFWPDKNNSAGFAHLFCQEDKIDSRRGND